MGVKRIALFGSTGSVGVQTLEIVRSLPDALQIVALCAGKNKLRLLQQVEEFTPQFFSCDTDFDAMDFRPAEYLDPAAIAVHPQVDMLVMATSGLYGMGPTLAALKAGKPVALANKEIMVVAGGIIMEHARRYGGQILPVDSEPSAIWQCLSGEIKPPKRVMLTASGGAFRDRTWESLATVTPKEALTHPTWSMGPKITIDSATLVNKAFEVIETAWLFGLDFSKIDVVMHRESIVHSFVEFVDGSWKGQLAPPDMRHAIQYAMMYPKRVANSALPTCEPRAFGSLSFTAMEAERYPCFNLVIETALKGPAWAAAIVGADEAVVNLFCSSKIKFTDIWTVTRATINDFVPPVSINLDSLVNSAEWAENHAYSKFSEWIK